jgi:hypothetical protein
VENGGVGGFLVVGWNRYLGGFSNAVLFALDLF